MAGRDECESVEGKNIGWQYKEERLGRREERAKSRVDEQREMHKRNGERKAGRGRES